MEDIKIKIYNNRYTLAAIIFFAVGVFVRIFRFGEIPSGFNQDEAFAAYETFSLINYGVDSAGYHNPTYFVSWGSGMNVLESYLAMPFCLLFGYSETVFRLPQLICGIFSLPALYSLLKRLFGEKTATVGLGILAVAPWHIMLCRWGLESNLAPAFLLFGLLFLVKGADKNAYFLLSALFYGLSLYSYSITWLAVPLMLLVFGIYIVVSSPKIKPLYVVGAMFILFIFALPHILFLLVNNGVIPEIRTDFLSIPKMVEMRTGEISLKNLFSLGGYKNLFIILFFQKDGLLWNSTDYGMFYPFSILFFILGIIKLILNVVSDFKTKRFSGSYFVLGGFLSSVLVFLLLKGVNINKSNCMHFFTLMIIAVGITAAADGAKNRKILKTAIVILYAVSFISFSSFYFTEYRYYASSQFRTGVGQAVETVNALGVKTVAVDRSILHSQILIYDKTPTNEFIDTVEYENYPNAYLSAKSFTKYTFGIDYDNPDGFDAYIISNDKLDLFSSEDYYIYTFENYSAVITKQ